MGNKCLKTGAVWQKPTVRIHHIISIIIYFYVRMCTLYKILLLLSMKTISSGYLYDVPVWMHFFPMFFFSFISFLLRPINSKTVSSLLFFFIPHTYCVFLTFYNEHWQDPPSANSLFAVCSSRSAKSSHFKTLHSFHFAICVSSVLRCHFQLILIVFCIGAFFSIQ